MTTLIFDFDGTLANSLGAIVNAINHQAENSQSRKICLQELSNLQNLSKIQLCKHLKISIFKLPLILYKIHAHLGKEITLLSPYPEINKTLKELKNTQ